MLAGRTRKEDLLRSSSWQHENLGLNRIDTKKTHSTCLVRKSKFSVSSFCHKIRRLNTVSKNLIDILQDI